MDLRSDGNIRLSEVVRHFEELEDPQSSLSVSAFTVRPDDFYDACAGGIETRCYWSLDVTFGERGLRTRQRTIARNVGWLRRVILSFLRQHPGAGSLAIKHGISGRNGDFLWVLVIKAT